MIYQSLIRSVLDYGAIALDSMSKQNKEKFDSIQARALYAFRPVGRIVKTRRQTGRASPPLLTPFLRSRPPSNQLGDLGSAVSSPSGVWGGAPAEIDFGAF